MSALQVSQLDEGARRAFGGERRRCGLRSPPPGGKSALRGLAGARCGWAVGLLAAGSYAFAVLPIQLSHFATVDALLTFTVVATVALAIRSATERAPWGRREWATWLLAGVMAGLAVGSKFSAVLLAVPLSAASLCGLPSAGARRKTGMVVARLAAVAIVAMVAFAVTNPFALIELPAFAQQIRSQSAMVSGLMDAPYTRQYIGTLPYLYLIRQTVQWGLGWPLGVAALGGLVWAVVVTLRRLAAPSTALPADPWPCEPGQAAAGPGRAGAGLAIMLAWVLPYLAVTGLFHAKFLRYSAPALPFLLVMGAGAIVAGLRWLELRWALRGRAAGRLVVALAALLTVGWAVAFTGVYRQEHPWVNASLWIYRSIPEGARLLTEHWDDALPLALDEVPERGPMRAYQRAELPMWDDDTEDKLAVLVAEVSRADYIILASNRLSAPIQRLNERYPMSSEYYRLLFVGDLGYRLVAEFTAYPRLGPVAVPDDRADESFTVYDHPHVRIFENAERLGPSELRARLEHALPLGAAPAGEERAGARGSDRGRAPGHASLRPQVEAPGAPLMLDQPVEALPVVSDFRWNTLCSRSAVLAPVLWWLVIGLIGWLAWPLLFPLMGGLRDRGYGVARIAAWLLLGWVHWMGVSLGLWQNRVEVLAVLVVLLALAGGVSWRVQRERIGLFWRRRRWLLLAEEAVFAAAFAALVLVRVLNPDLWHPFNGGEKFMESAFLNAILRSASFPPYDPYYAGGIINYYYYGLYLVGVLIKLTGIAPEVAFNLAAPMLYALAAMAVFGVAVSLAGRQGRRRMAGVGLVSVAMTLLLANLQGLIWLVRAAGRVIGGASAPTFDYWAASRVIPFTINEFPLWTYVFADLHPHLIALPVGVLVIGLALNWVRRWEARRRGRSHRRLILPPHGRLLVQDGLNLMLLSVALGALGAINTWDSPVYILLAAGALLLAGWRSGRAGRVLVALLLAAALPLAATALYGPFHVHYEPQLGAAGGGPVGRYLGLVRAGTGLPAWLTVWGGFLFVALSHLVIQHRLAARPRAPHSRRPSPARPWVAAVLGYLAVLAVLAALDRAALAVAVLPCCLALPLILVRRQPATDAFVALLLALGWAVIAGIEVVYVRDLLDGGEWRRMNTVFKLSIPAWVLLGLSGGPILDRVRRAVGRAPGWVRAPWRATLAVLLAGSAVFLVLGAPARVEDRFPGARPAIGTLDGTAYMTAGRYAWPNGDHVIDLVHEREAIRWLTANVQGAPVVAEAPAAWYEVDGQSVNYDYYRAGGLRVASFTGFPTLLGQHQIEQRPADQVNSRQAAGRELFETTDIARARELLRDLRVRYIYVGQLERILFQDAALHKFDALVELGDLEQVYANRRVTIYRVG